MRERGATTPRAGERRVHEQLARLFSNEPSTEATPIDAMSVDEEEKPTRTIITTNVCVEPMEVSTSQILNSQACR